MMGRCWVRFQRGRKTRRRAGWDFDAVGEGFSTISVWVVNQNSKGDFGGVVGFQNAVVGFCSLDLG